MGYPINALTGAFDRVKVPVKNVTSQPDETVGAGPDGNLVTGFVSSEGILYFRTNGNLYKLVGTIIEPQIPPVSIAQGQPMGFGNLGLTYAGAVT